MAPRTVYANLPDGLANLSLWDLSLADMGSLGVIPCTASGTNAIVLTPIATLFPPNINNPPNANQCFSFVAPATSTNSVTVQIANVTNSLKLYRMDAATQAASGDIQQNVTYVVSFGSALNSSAGGFQIQSPVNNEINPIITGATISNSTLSGCTITTSTYNGNTWTAGTGTLTIAAAKTLTASNSLTLAGTDSTTMTFPTTSATIARTDSAQTFTGVQNIATIAGGSAAGSSLTLESTSSGSPSGDTAFLYGSTVTLGSAVNVAATVNLGSTFGGGITVNIGNASNGVNALNFYTGGGAKQVLVSGGGATTITLPTATDTLVGKATTDTLTNKTFDTAGTGNVFKINGVTITANTGTGSNVLATSPTLVTPTLGAATATSVAFSPTTGGLIGTTAADSASAGTVGEVLSSSVAAGSQVSLSNGVSANMTSLSLTAGDWDVSANFYFNPAGTTTVTLIGGSLSQTTGTLDTTTLGALNEMRSASFTPANVMNALVGPLRVNVSGTTTIFAVAVSAFGTSTMAVYGIIRARRIR